MPGSVDDHGHRIAYLAWRLLSPYAVIRTLAAWGWCPLASRRLPRDRQLAPREEMRMGDGGDSGDSFPSYEDRSAQESAGPAGQCGESLRPARPAGFSDRVKAAARPRRPCEEELKAEKADNARLREELEAELERRRELEQQIVELKRLLEDRRRPYREPRPYRNMGL